MNKWYQSSKFLLFRRIVQLGILFIFVGGNMWSWNILKGNLSFSKLFDIIPFSDPFAVLQMLFAGATIAFDVAIGALIIVLFYGLFAGRAFCSWVCPVNIITDVSRWIRLKLSSERIGGFLRISRSTRIWIFGLSLLISFIFGVTAFEMVSPVSMIHRGIIFGMGFGWTVIISILLFDIFAVKDGFCGHLCPLGGFYSIISKYSLLRIHHTTQNCSLCMLCKDVCPENNILKQIGKKDGYIDFGSCTNCGRCIDVCEEDSLKFGFRKYKIGV